MGQPLALVREIQALGDKVLSGDGGSKLVFANLVALNHSASSTTSPGWSKSGQPLACLPLTSSNTFRH